MISKVILKRLCKICVLDSSVRKKFNELPIVKDVCGLRVHNRPAEKYEPTTLVQCSVVRPVEICDVCKLDLVHFKNI